MWVRLLPHKENGYISESGSESTRPKYLRRQIMAEGFSLVDLGKLAEPINTLINKIADAAGILYEPTRIRKKSPSRS